MSTVPILIAEDDHKSIVIDRPAIVVGRSRRRADVCIDDRSISAVHCEIAVRENCLQVRNRGLNGIRINGRKSAEGVLQDGDILEIARLKYRVLMAGDSGHPNALQSSRSNDWLVRLAGMELGPMPWAELSLMVQRGELTRTDEVRWSEQPHWIPAATADGLFDAVAVAAKSAAPMNGKVAKLTKSGNSQADHSTVPAETSAEPGNGSGNESRPLEFGSSDNLQISFKASVDSLIDTATNLPDETDASARALKPGLSISRDGKSRKANSQHDKPQIDDDLGWSLDDGLEEEFADPGGHNAAIASGNPAGLPPLPLPPPLPIATQPIPLPAAPPFRPIVGRSDTFLDRVFDAVIDPVLVYVPVLRTWPAVATVVAGLAIVIFLMRPSYEGAEVSGRVTLNGQPLTDATISFTDLKNGFGASAVVAPDGTFEVITLKGGMRPGTYSVAVMPLKPESPEIVSELQRQFSESHNGGMRDEETMMDSQGEPEDRPDRLSKEPEKEIFDLPATTIPFNYRSIQTSGISKEITEDGPNELLIELATIPG